MVLGKLLVPRRPTTWMIVGQGPVVLAVGAGGGCLDIFTLFFLSPLSPLWETARFRLKHYLKGPLNPNQSANHPQIFSYVGRYNKSTMPVNAEKYFYDPPWIRTHDLGNTA